MFLYNINYVKKVNIKKVNIKKMNFKNKKDREKVDKLLYEREIEILKARDDAFYSVESKKDIQDPNSYCYH